PTRAALRAASPVPTAPAAAPAGPPAAEATPSAAASAASPAAKIPEVLPDLTLPGLDRTPHRLTDWKGHALLGNFWATWCESCRESRDAEGGRVAPGLGGLHPRSGSGCRSRALEPFGRARADRSRNRPPEPPAGGLRPGRGALDQVLPDPRKSQQEVPKYRRI